MEWNFCLSLLAVRVKTSINNVDKLKTCHLLVSAVAYVCIVALTFHSGKPVCAVWFHWAGKWPQCSNLKICSL